MLPRLGHHHPELRALLKSSLTFGRDAKIPLKIDSFRQIYETNQIHRNDIISVGVAVLLTIGIASLRAQGPDGGRTAQALFAALDTDKDGTLTRPELESGFNSWFTAWDTTHSGTLTQPQILAGISTLLPAPPAVKPGQANTFNPAGNSTPIPVRKLLWTP